MFEFLQQKVSAYPGDKLAKYNYLRELLQLLLLKKLDESGYFKQIAFVGGTALRIIYDLERFSEDLDFSLVNSENFSFTALMDKLSYEFEHESLELNIKVKDKYPVAAAQIKFKNLLYPLGLSEHKDEIIFIKLDIDQNPPEGHKTQLSIINKEFMLAINHFDLPSLYAGKLHAILQRQYTKGRDYYDYLWYHGKKIVPNLELLNNALTQSTGENPQLTEADLQEALKKRFSSVDFKKVQMDLEPFIVDHSELRFFTQDMFLQTLAG